MKAQVLDILETSFVKMLLLRFFIGLVVNNERNEQGGMFYGSHKFTYLKLQGVQAIL